jgi:hypothetical protein
LVTLRVHALPVHDVELLLQRHLRKAGLAGTQRRPGDGAAGRTDRGAVAGIAMPAAAANGGTEPCSQRGRQECGPYGLIIGGGRLGCRLCRGVLLTVILIGGKGAELLICPGDHRDRRRRGGCDAGAQSNHERYSTRETRIDISHARFPSVERHCDFAAPVRSAQAAVGVRHRAKQFSRKARQLPLHEPHRGVLTQMAFKHIIAIMSIFFSAGAAGKGRCRDERLRGTIAQMP